MLTTVVDLPATLVAPRTARALTRAVLNAWGYTVEEELDLVEIVVSELITNAVLHAGAGVPLRLHLHAGHRLRVTVSDGSAIQPIVHSLDGEADSGRGLQIIAAIVDRWGVDDRGDEGKSVWVELSLDRAGVSSATADTRSAACW
jgi:anti-sigma regulatory factor (Ser/Thr protein kinase)